MTAGKLEDYAQRLNAFWRTPRADEEQELELSLTGLRAHEYRKTILGIERGRADGTCKRGRWLYESYLA